ncbi:hypothetical protein Cni_G26720 [Canna indica]|uniref:Uncharacterized protein n=1 Tax=Canna indica TaxID=4628 RepID=A0AAQ3L6Q3_9LILI|nr:hypothetical protein Cni_G26720 [Canna indica]
MLRNHQHPLFRHAEFHEDRICAEEDYYTNVSRTRAERPHSRNVNSVHKHKRACEAEDRFQTVTYQVSETIYEESVDTDAGEFIMRKHLVVTNSA